MKTLKYGVKGAEVEQWQYFLLGDAYPCIANAKFDKLTYHSTVQFQSDYGLKSDGVVGRGTYRKAMELGFEYLEGEADTHEKPKMDGTGGNFPPAPDFITLPKEKTEALFGKIEYVSENGKLRVTNGWDRKNIVKVFIPQLLKIGQTWGHDKGKILFHRRAAQQLIDLWAAWEAEGLLEHVVMWSGSYQPRFIRGNPNRLSNHAYGTAFDINVKQNRLGKRPALLGEYGCVRELVPLANQFGFFWGGHYRRRKDGMHFEVVKIV